VPDDIPQSSDQPDETAMLRAALQAAQARIAALEQIIKGFQRARFGQSSEHVDAGQLALELGRAPVLPEPANDSPAKPRDGTGAGQRRRNRGALPVHLERVEEVLDLTDQGCPCCGVAMRRIGEDRSERLDVVPAQLRVRVTIRPRYACRRCEEGVHQAPAPARAIPGGLPTEALLAQVLVAKYGDGLPLYRQAAILQRQGIHLDRSNAGGDGRAMAGSGPMRWMIAFAAAPGHRRSPTSTPRTARASATACAIGSGWSAS
jgi:transposase